ncbi:family 43 glycosylhydrolase [Nocardioides sp. Kera G14]|uniref:family 43 glycosylhydrolase n=1 Tax=Nocardioides sp. Kera G14 TaxID=2884264 RepID=UPI001D1196EF|nr:family 43 glycosylhydrolase [Nocardioides sp. Kera G14]UDY23248.1 family 43 glycosylhydrolase [Nocardioides sp. Kera G14]
MLLAGLMQPAEAAKKHKKHGPKPPRSLTTNDFPDPSVVKTSNGYVVVGTGPNLPRMTSRNGLAFKAAAPALTRAPAWARGVGMWAADLVQRGARWVLYFAAPVRGGKSSSHCIGVATGARPDGTFTPLDDAPLVCPAGLDTPPAEDQFIDTPGATTSNPATAHGAIDPSFTILGGRSYLLYKTDGSPSTIRLLPLSGDGLHAAAASRQLLTSSGVVENPVIFRHGPFWYLLTSEGSYATCSYRTVWRRSKSPLTSWQHQAAHLFLSTSKQGLCGPGGADVVTNGKNLLVYFHAWTCRHRYQTCDAPLNPRRSPVRAVYGLRLGFTKHGFPMVDRWLKPRFNR